MRNRSLRVAELVMVLVQISGSAMPSDVRTVDARNLSDAFVGAIEKVAPAVVGIHGKRKLDPEELERINSIFRRLPKEYRDLIGQYPPLQEWQGSGVLIRSDGLILTNNHVLEDAETLTVSLPDGRRFTAKVAGRDPYTDVALLKIQNGPTDFPTVILGDSDRVRVGEWVLAIGSPFGLAGSVSQGIVSAKHRTNDDVPIGQENYFFYKDFIQTTAAINVGNSGGPLINLDGEVIGINNSIQTAGVQANLGIGFAIPSNMAEFIVDSLLKNGRVIRGWLGVEIETLHNANSHRWGTPQGALVLKVRPNTPAERAGVEKGDVIVGFNHTKVTSGNHLQNLVTQTHVGTSVVLVVLRDKRKLPLNVTVEEYPPYLLPGTKEQEETLLGFTAEELSSENRQQYGYGVEARGMVITKVVPDRRAERMGLKPGDLILEIDDPVPTREEYMAKIDELSKRVNDGKETTVLLHVDRVGAADEFPRYFSLKVTGPKI